MKTDQNLPPKSMVQHPRMPVYPIKRISQCCPLKSSEFSAKTNGTTSDNARVFQASSEVFELLKLLLIGMFSLSKFIPKCTNMLR